MTSIAIPSSVTTIDNSAFANCSSLTTITIGKGVDQIGSNAFASCRELMDVYCYAEDVPNTHREAFSDSYINYAKLHVPDKSINKYKGKLPWMDFGIIIGLNGTTPETPKCEKPTIRYEGGKLKFSSTTEGAEFVTEITSVDSKKYYTNEIELRATYNISVYATKSGYENSETATATLCWIDAEPTMEGTTDYVIQISSKAALIKSEGGILTIEGIEDGTLIYVYSPDGKQAGSAVSRNGTAYVSTNIPSGNTAIVKIGETAIKFMIK